jgi:hypothetical protein
MRHLTTSILVTLTVLLGSAGESFALPECPSNSRASTWTNCFGTYTFANGDKYVGEYKDNKRNGQGTYTFADGGVKEGIFENGQFKYAQKVTPIVTAKKTAKKSSGSNQSSLPECPGSPLVGSISDVAAWDGCEGTHAFGPSSKHAGQKYVGEFKDGKFHGQGTITFSAPHKSAGEKYVGEYKDHKLHGQGTGTFSAPNKNAGEKYVGEHKDGKPHGQGTLTFSAPHKYAVDKYVGEFKNGKLHGQGTYTKPDGKVFEGIFENGQFKYAKKP